MLPTLLKLPTICLPVVCIKPRGIRDICPMSRTVLFLSYFNSRVISSQGLPNIQDLSVDSCALEGVRNFERLIGQLASVPYQRVGGARKRWCGLGLVWDSNWDYCIGQ